MDTRLKDATQAVFGRVKATEEDNVAKIIGYILMKDKGELEMLNLARASDAVLQDAILHVKEEIGLVAAPSLEEQVASVAASTSRLHLRAQEQELRQRPSIMIPQEEVAGYYAGACADQEKLKKGHGYFGYHSPVSHYENIEYAVASGVGSDNSSGRVAGERSSSLDALQAFAWKPCVYFARGFCKHGSNCRFLHGPSKDEAASPSNCHQSFWLGSSEDSCSGGGGSGSLAQLEAELRELLRGRRAPVSIASLPQLYYERHGRTLQAEGYLTESQRHGKAGFSLTKLLARLKNTVTLIDRPHGQHAVVLAEEAHKFIRQKDCEDQVAFGNNNSVSRQIYLTFPSESTFTEDDVRNHFRQYGEVQDVRIPYQNKRMFGFVTFLEASSVRAILSEGNPHYICGARVLVKPYREKGKHSDRTKFTEKGELGRFPLTRANENNKEATCLPLGSPLPYGQDMFGQPVDQIHDFQKRQLLELRRVRSAQWWNGEGLEGSIHQQGHNSFHCGSREGDLRLAGGTSLAEGDSLRMQQSQSLLGLRHHRLELGSMDVLGGGGGDAAVVRQLLEGDEAHFLTGAAANLASSSSGSLSSGHSGSSSHNLPESPFLNNNNNNNNNALDFSEDMKQQQQQQQQPFRRVSKASSYESLGSHSFAASSSTPVSVISEHDDVLCAICVEYIVDPITLDCTHVFCQSCLSQVLSNKDECPICRCQVPLKTLQGVKRHHDYLFSSTSLVQSSYVVPVAQYRPPSMLGSSIWH